MSLTEAIEHAERDLEEMMDALITEQRRFAADLAGFRSEARSRLRAIQTEQAKVRETLDGQSEALAGHAETLDGHTGVFAAHTTLLHEILDRLPPRS